MQTLHEVGIISDKALAIAIDRYHDKREWDESDINEAIEALEYDILNNGADWDEDGSYRVDFAIECERILNHEDKDEQLVLIKEARTKRVHDYCVSVVNYNPTWYCSEYCH